MSNWIEDGRSKLVMDTTAAALLSWAKESGPNVRKFLEAGEADAPLMSAIRTELEAKRKSQGRLKFDDMTLLHAVSTATAPLTIK